MSYHVQIEKACSAIANGSLKEAREILRREYPFTLLANDGRSYTNREKTRIFIRDGFVDRYSGDKMVFPPVLRILSSLMPEEFPFHKNWKMSECHIAYWHLLPTIDHVVPVSRGGSDDESNWVCTSQMRNSAKANWLIDELGWELRPSNTSEEWDGQLAWFMRYAEQHPDVLSDRYVFSWYQAAKQEIKTLESVRLSNRSPDAA